MDNKLINHDSHNYKPGTKISYMPFLFLIFVFLFNFNSNVILAKDPNTTVEYSLLVLDSLTSSKIHSAKVTLKTDDLTEAYIFTNPAGKATIRNLKPGYYQLIVSFPEYKDYSHKIHIDENHTTDTIRLVMLDINVTTSPVTVTGYSFSEIETIQGKTGIQIFDATTYHSAPSEQMTDLVQQNVLGAVKAPTGEVHIRGEHGEYSYFIDDIPIPLGVFGGLNEIVDSRVINRMNILTGCFPAEYGGQLAAVMDIQTKVPSGHFHFDFSSYAGSYLVFNGTKPFSPGNPVPIGMASNVSGDTLGAKVGPFRAINSNGESVSISNHIGLLGYFLSMSRLETDRRVDSPTPTLFNDHGTDYFLFGKIDYLITDNDYITINLNYGNTANQVPFDISSQGYSPDNQKSFNSFETVSYYHNFSNEENSEKTLFAGFYLRQGGLNFNPGIVSPVNFQFAGDSVLYSLTEDRSFTTSGFRTKFDDRLFKEFKFSTGLNFSITNGTENFTSRDSLNKPGPSIYTNYTGSDFGLFGEFEYLVYDWFRIDGGLRYDQHITPDAPLQLQFSPRIKLNFFADDQNTFILYFGRLFMPTNIEGLRLIASNVSASGLPTLPEKSDYYEADWVHSFNFGLVLKADMFYKYSSPGIDDQTIGASAIKTPVNIAQTRTTGLEAGLSYSHPTIPITTYLNASICHAYGEGAITGGFLNIAYNNGPTDLDHDQRLSVVFNINYQPHDWFVNFTGIYGSGLRNGSDVTFGSGLFDFNSSGHVNPYTVFNVSFGHTYHFEGETTLEPSIYINNIFDNDYILKGAYFSSASWGERRNVVLKLAFHA
jgi:hypothetical protein